MTSYNPDKWMLLKITGDDPHYRVFGSWSGGYLDGDSWRMNSGITRVEEDDDYYYFYGSSGSCYTCVKERYGANVYGYGVAQSYVDRSDGRIEIISECPDNIMTMDWIIS